MTERDKLILAFRMVMGSSTDFEQVERPDLTKEIVQHETLKRLWIRVYGMKSPSGLSQRKWLKLRNDLIRASRKGVPMRVVIPGGRTRRQRVRLSKKERDIKQTKVLEEARAFVDEILASA